MQEVIENAIGSSFMDAEEPGYCGDIVFENFGENGSLRAKMYLINADVGAKKWLMIPDIEVPYNEGDVTPLGGRTIGWQTSSVRAFLDKLEDAMPPHVRGKIIASLNTQIGCDDRHIRVKTKTCDNLWLFDGYDLFFGELEDDRWLREAIWNANSYSFWLRSMRATNYANVIYKEGWIGEELVHNKSGLLVGFFTRR